MNVEMIWFKEMNVEWMNEIEMNNDGRLNNE